MRCYIDVIMPRINYFNMPLATITLIKGKTLGGGEAAICWLQVTFVTGN